jgi:hypothetical protein
MFRMCYGENGTVKFLETLEDNVYRHSYSIMQIKKLNYENILGLPINYYNYWGNYTWLCIYTSKIKKTIENCEKMH